MALLTAGPDWSHRSGQSWLTNWTPEKVAEAPDPIIALSAYIEQALGVAFPTKKDITILRKRVYEILDRYPRADFYTLCKVVAFNRQRRRRFARVYTVVDSFREAMAAGWLPELTVETCLKERVQEILTHETDPDWRARLISCPDDEARQVIINEWEQRAKAA